MYLLTIHVPVFVDGDAGFLASDWKAAIELLRNSLGGRYGPIKVLCPWLPLESGEKQVLVPVEELIDVEVVRSFDKRCRARAYWMRARHQWKKDLRGFIAQADVVHSGMEDVYRPINYAGHREAVRQGKATVFVSDTDTVLQHWENAQSRDWKGRLEAKGYCWIFSRCMRYGVRTASLSLLKGRSLMNRYERFAANARLFHDTSFRSTDIVDEDRLGRRLATLTLDRPIRLVYCGRLVDRKGVDDSLRLVRGAIQHGAKLTFDIIGDGPERPELEKLASELGLAGAVRFLGSRSYGPALLRDLGEYDALLFTPKVEDTPRMIFDAYAAGLPMIGSDIEYVKERADEERATILLPRAELARAAERLALLDRDRQGLADLSRRARDAAQCHSADEWYRRRAEWTFEAVDKHYAALRR